MVALSVIGGTIHKTRGVDPICELKDVSHSNLIKMFV